MAASDAIKILVVDDLPEKLLVYSSILEEPGQQVVTARTGADALRQVLRHEFAVILLDVNMPTMDGFEAARLIRSRRRSAHTPIIFVTAHADEMHALRGYSYGAVDFIQAPIVPEVLQAKVRVFVELFRKTEEVQRQAEELRALQAREHERQLRETNDRLELALEAGRLGAWEWSLGANLQSWSPILESILGFERGTFSGATAELRACLHPEDEDRVVAALREAVRTRSDFRLEHRILRRRGGEGWIELLGRVFGGEREEPLRLTGVCRDITERKRTEQAVSDSERRYRELVQGLPAAVYTCDTHGRITLFNEAAVTLWGREPVLDKDAWCGSWRIYHPDGKPMALDQCPMAVTLREGRSVRGQEILIERPDGTRRHVLPHPEPIRDASGAAVGAVNMLMDITELKRAEEAQARLAAIVESTDDAVISKTLDGVITTCNQAGARLFGYRVDELVGSHISILIPPERRAEEEEILQRVRRGEPITHLETVRVTKDGRPIDISLTVSPVRGPDGRVVGASKIARDITERKNAERTLLESENRLRAMFGQAAVGIMVMDGQGRLFEANGRMSQIVGRRPEELSPLSCEDLTHPDEWRAYRGAVERVFAGEQQEFAGEYRFRRGDGSWVWVNVTVSSLPGEDGLAQRLIAVVEDISARKQAEEELRRHREHLEHLVRERTAELEASHQRLRVADRLASIGTLAAGLGHDMGNLLLPVRMRLDALRRMPLTDAALEDVAAIADACEYLKRLTQGLRLFALDGGEGRVAGNGTELGAWWDEVAPFLRNAVKRGIDLEASIPHGLPPIPISAPMLTQAVYNLVQNARDAMNGRDAGRIGISASPGADGRSVVLEVSDNGPGMSEDVLNRCMEPFFTTKTRGISTGLGLALVRGAVHQVGGWIDVRSRLGEGTTFRLTFPRAEAPDDRADPVEGSEPVRACVHLSDARLRAYAMSLLQAHGVGVVPGPWSPDVPATLLILDGSGSPLEALDAFLAEDRERWAIVLGADVPPTPSSRADYLGPRPTAGQLRDAIARCVRPRQRRPQEASL